MSAGTKARPRPRQDRRRGAWRRAALAVPLALLIVLVAAAAARADELAYSCEGDICTIDPDNAANHADLTETPQNDDNYPAWSPDGSTIAFNSDYSGNGDIYLTSPSRPGIGTDITDTPEISEGIAVWSPDGTRIAYIGTTPTNHEYVYVSPASGASPPQAVDGTATESSEPTWSPDGTQLALVHGTSVYLTAPSESATAVPLKSGLGVEPQWSPDGKRIAATNANTGAVRLIAADGSGVVTELPVAAAFSLGVRWSPDSSEVVYRDVHDEIRVAPTEPAGAGYTIKLPPGVIVPEEPSFSPDGSRIAFIARHNTPGNEYEQIFIAAAMPGAEAVQLTKAQQTALYPRWKPGAGAVIPPPVGGPIPAPPVGTPPTTTGGSLGSGSGTSPGASAPRQGPTTIKFAEYKHPLIYAGFLGAAYVDCSLGSTNEACRFQGEATFVAPITHSLTYAGGKRAKPTVVATGAVTVPGGEKKPLKLKLTAAGRKLAKPGHTLKLALTITETAPGAKPQTTTRTLTVKVAKQH